MTPIAHISQNAVRGPRLLAAFVLALSLAALPALAQQESGSVGPSVDPATLQFEDRDVDPNAPDVDYVWENDYIVEGVTYRGFLRPRRIDGFVWQQGHFDNGRWTPPHFVPTHNRVDQIWVSGHRGADGYWVLGHWRRVHLNGYVWVEGHFVGDQFIPGHWRPIRPRPDYVWVPGYAAPAGIWVDGFWRPHLRVGFVWVGGYYKYGYWTPGFWRPLHPRPGFLWVAGYYGPGNVWVPGFWRPIRRPGYYWARPYWRRGVWVPGRWIGGPRPRIVRRYRVYRVPAIRRHRYIRSRVYRYNRQVRHEQRERLRERREDRRERREDRRERRQDRRERRRRWR